MDAPVCLRRPDSTHDHFDSNTLAESRTNQEEFHQLPSLETIPPNHRSTQAEVALRRSFLIFTTASRHYTAQRRQEYSLLIFHSLSGRRPGLLSVQHFYLRHVQLCSKLLLSCRTFSPQFFSVQFPYSPYLKCSVLVQKVFGLSHCIMSISRAIVCDKPLEKPGLDDMQASLPRLCCDV